MSATNIDLGLFRYVYLQNVNCNNDAGGDATSSFSWNMPYIPPSQGPIMFMQVVQLYVDHDDGAGAGYPQHLRYTNINGYNSYSTGNSQLAGLMQRDTLAAHWTIQPEAPLIQVPTNITQAAFTINRNTTGAVITLGTNGCIDIVLKLIYPKQGLLTNDIMAANVRTL